MSGEPEKAETAILSPLSWPEISCKESLPLSRAEAGFRFLGNAIWFKIYTANSRTTPSWTKSSSYPVYEVRNTVSSSLVIWTETQRNVQYVLLGRGVSQFFLLLLPIAACLIVNFSFWPSRQRTGNAHVSNARYRTIAHRTHD